MILGFSTSVCLSVLFEGDQLVGLCSLFWQSDIFLSLFTCVTVLMVNKVIDWLID